MRNNIKKDNMQKKKGKRRVLWGFIYVSVFIFTFAISAVFKLTRQPAWTKNYTVDWNDSIGEKHTDLSYGKDDSNKFDLYIPADHSQSSYGLIVYLHAGGFTMGDKSDDTEILQWLCSKGYVTAGINYTLRNETNNKSVYTQSLEIREAIPIVIEEAEKLGYPIDEMAISGGSAGGTLALLYAYRDQDISPVPVRMVFEAVGPSSFYPEDWESYGFNQDTKEAKAGAAGLFSVMAGKKITPDLLGTKEYDEIIKDISALLWINENTVPTLMAYGKYDKVQPYQGSIRLDKKLTDYHVPHDYIVCEHSSHGLQNDHKQYRQFYEKIEEYLNQYMPKKLKIQKLEIFFDCLTTTNHAIM